jgi:hypothetical protein
MAPRVEKAPTPTKRAGLLVFVFRAKREVVQTSERAMR